jgi:serine protease Do
LSARRIVRLASGAGLSAAAFFAGPGGTPNTSLPASSVAHAAESAGRTAGFADIVEKVQPAVISVRIRAQAGQEMMGLDDETGSSDALGSAERFLGRFGIRAHRASLSSSGSGTALLSKPAPCPAT